MSDSGKNRRNRREMFEIRRRGAAFNRKKKPVFETRHHVGRKRQFSWQTRTKDEMSMSALGLNAWQWRIQKKRYDLQQRDEYMTLMVEFQYYWTGDLKSITTEVITATKPSGKQSTWSPGDKTNWHKFKRNHKNNRTVYRKEQPHNPITANSSTIVFNQEINAWVETTRRFCQVQNKVLKDPCVWTNITETYENEHATHLVNRDLYDRKHIGYLPLGYAGHHIPPVDHELYGSAKAAYLKPFQDFALIQDEEAGDGDTSGIADEIQSEFGNTFMPEPTTTTTTTETAPVGSTTPSAEN